jgi:ATP-dependent RNA helicase DeaD
MPYKIKELAKKYMDGYELITVKREQSTTNLTDQIYFEVKASDKFEALCRIIDISPNFYGLIFCRTKIDVDTLNSRLVDRGYDAEAIHGDISQIQRERTLDKFKKQRSNILVATDVAARGIDVNNLTHVINFSLPQEPELYIHRIGRTGRAGNRGTAITFITPSEYRRFMFIQRITKTDIKKSQLPKVEEIIQTRRNKINHDIEVILDSKIDKEYYNWAKSLLGEKNPTEILAAILSYSFEDEFKSHNYSEIKEFGGKRDKPLEGHGKTRLFVALGKKDNLNARKLVDLIVGKVQIKSRDIRDIEIMENFSFLTVPFSSAEDIIIAFEERGKRALISIAKNKKRR